MKTSLLSAAAIKANITMIGQKGAEFAKLVHETAVQTVLHAQTHGDATLADDLVKMLRETTPGYVWQGLVAWYKKYSPIFWDAEGNVRLLKPDEKGYKPFDPESAEAKPAAEDRAVSARTDREIKPYSIASVKQLMASQLNKLEKAQEEGGRGVVGNPTMIRAFLTETIAFMDKVSVLEPKEKTEKPEIEGEVVVETPAKVA